MKLRVIGATGFIGAYVAAEARAHWEVIDERVDITSATALRAAFDRHPADAVVLLAAIADIDVCEREPERCRRVNLDGAANVARECARAGARLVFTSTGAVYDGARHGYTEADPPSPLSCYGKSKAEAEWLISEILPETAAVRLSLVLGRGRGSGTNSLVDKLEQAFRSGTPVRVPAGEFRNPIDAGTTADYLLELAANREASGIFHVGASEAASRLELTARLARAMGYDPAALVQPLDRVPPDRAPRGRDHFLLSNRLQRYCATPAPALDEVIERAVHAAF